MCCSCEIAGSVKQKMELEQVIIAICSWVVDTLTKALEARGYQVKQSFDLRSALQGADYCSCPDHGTEDCTCEYVVLFAYEQWGPPLLIIAHGRGEMTWLRIRSGDSLPASIASALDDTIGAAASEM